MTSAGLRAVEMLKPVLISLGMVPVHDAVSIPLRLRLDADGQLHPDHVMQEAAQRMLSGLHRMGRVLGPLRETAGAQVDLATLAS